MSPELCAQATEYHRTRQEMLCLTTGSKELDKLLGGACAHRLGFGSVVAPALPTPPATVSELLVS